MIAYFAASMSRRLEIRKLAREFERDIPGLKINSKWLDMEPAANAIEAPGVRQLSPKGSRELRERRQSRAIMDRGGVYECNILVRFTDDLRAKMIPSYLATGSRMVEMGMALALGTPVIVVGGEQTLFDNLPEVQHVKTVTGLKRTLRRIASGEKLAHTKSKATLRRALRRMELEMERA